MPSVVFSFGVSVERGLNKAARRRRTREVLSSGQKRSRQTRLISATAAAASSGCLDILAGDWKFLTDDLQIVPADLKQYLRYQIDIQDLLDICLRSRPRDRNVVR